MFETIIDAILSNVLEIVITVISLIVAHYVIPCIKNNLIPWLEEKRLLSIIRKFVQAAEKLAESNVIKKSDKKAKVVELLEKQGVVVDARVEAFIEGCVKELDTITSVMHEEIVKIEEN